MHGVYVSRGVHFWIFSHRCTGPILLGARDLITAPSYARQMVNIDLAISILRALFNKDVITLVFHSLIVVLHPHFCRFISLFAETVQPGIAIGHHRSKHIS